MQDCHCRIAQVKYQGQTGYIRILDLKPYVIASDIDFSLCIIFAKCSLSSSFTSKKISLQTLVVIISESCKRSKLQQPSIYSNMNSIAWPTCCKGLICSKNPEQTVLSLNSFKSVENTKIKDSGELIVALIPQADSEYDLEKGCLLLESWQCQVICWAAQEF